MRTRTITETIYKYNELSDEAKEKAKQWWLDGQEPQIFSEGCEESLAGLFSKSELKVEYSLGYCQGDGLNIYGNIYLDELLNHIKQYFTEKELKFFSWVFNEYGSSYKLTSNNRYAYCICDRHDYMEYITEYMEDEEKRNIPYKTLQKFTKLAQNYMSNLCAEYEKSGYEYFYEISDEDMEEICDANDYEFYESGRPA